MSDLAIPDADEILASLTDAQRRAIDVIVGCPDLAWLPASAVIQAGIGHTPEVTQETVAELIAIGLVDVWENDSLGTPLEGAPFLTLKPFGSSVLDRSIVERLEMGVVENEVKDDHNPNKKMIERRSQLEERPLWGREGQVDTQPFRCPNLRGFRRLRAAEAELIVDPSAGPEHLVDENDEEVTLFAGEPDASGVRGRGIPIVIDRRLGRRASEPNGLGARARGRAKG